MVFFQNFPVLENAKTKFQDFLGFLGPIRTLKTCGGAQPCLWWEGVTILWLLWAIFVAKIHIHSWPCVPIGNLREWIVKLWTRLWSASYFTVVQYIAMYDFFNFVYKRERTVISKFRNIVIEVNVIKRFLVIRVVLYNRVFRRNFQLVKLDTLTLLVCILSPKNNIYMDFWCQT